MPSAATPILYKGDLKLAELVGGVNQGFDEGGNNTQFAFTANSEQKSVTATGIANYGQALGGVNVKQPTTLTISGNTFTPYILGAWNMGKAAAASDVGDSVTDDPHVAHLGKGIWIGYHNITSVVVSDDPETSPYTVDDDYTVDPVLGMIYPVVGGAITENEDILIDFDWAATQGYVTDAGTESSLDWELMLYLQNMENDNYSVVHVWHFNGAASGDADLRGEDHIVWAFTGIIKTPAGKPGPYKVYDNFVPAS